MRKTTLQLCSLCKTLGTACIVKY